MHRSPAIEKRILNVICLGFLAACKTPMALNGVGPSGGQQLTVGERFSISSEVLGETRDYWVYLPPSYDKPLAQKDYPVLYLLDGAVHFQTTTGVVTHMSPHQIPELIVVGIPSTNRMMDMSPTESTLGMDGKAYPEYAGKTGGGDVFLQFLEDELIPKVETTYRTTEHRVLAGHSAGGLLALHALLNQPDLFDAYVAMDPSLWWDNQVLVRQAETIFAGEHEREASVYVSLANNADCKTPGCWDAIQSSYEEFGAVLEGAETPELSFSRQYFEKESHGSVPLVSLYYGLQSVFEGH